MKIKIFLVMALVAIFGTSTVTVAANAETDPTIAAVGDIACPKGFTVTSTACHHQAVADLIRSKSPDAYLVLGDIQYNRGELGAGSPYDVSFGSLNSIAKPSPGNHEYLDPTNKALPYASYFNDTAPYWYSYNVGSWHILSIDSNCGRSTVGGCGATSNQAKWILADLAANPTACTLAYWHHPRYNSGEHGGATNMTWTWKNLYNKGVDVILNGHEHSYQRFKPLNASGAVTANGMVEFVVGTGGKSHYTGGSTSTLSAFRDTSNYGAFFMTLHPTSADYEFVNEAGAVVDSGSINCR